MTYAWWTAALKLGNGRELTREQMSALGITSEPQCGFYRKRTKNGTDEAVAIWDSGAGLVAVIGDRVSDPDHAWSWGCKWPISEVLYREIEAGGAWPDEVPSAPAVGIGHNLPTDPHEAIMLEYQSEKDMAEEFMRTPVTTQEQADKIAVWSKKLASISKRATDLHRVEKQPHLDAGRAVDDKWREAKEGPDLLSKRLKSHLNPYLRELERIEVERQRKAQEERDAKRRAAEEAERAARQSENEYEKAQAERLAREAAEAEKAAEARNPNAGRTGAKVSLRTFVSAEITDYDALVIALKDRPEMRELVQSLANRAAKSGKELAGMKIVEEKRAA